MTEFYVIKPNRDCVDGYCHTSNHSNRALWIAKYTSCAIQYTLTSVLGEGCLHTVIQSTILSFPPLIYP
jgi:hypothetical protein